MSADVAANGQDGVGTPRTRATALRKSTDFDQVFAQGARLSAAAFSLHYRPNDCAHARLGLGVSRRVSRKATRRNRIKRVLRETFRAHVAGLPAFDIVVVARPVASELTNAALRDALLVALKRLQQRAQPSDGKS